MLSFFLPGRNRKLHHTLRLTALVLMIALICPGIGTAWAAAIETEVSQVTLLEAVQNTRKSFIQLYRDVWKEDSLNAKLEKAVSRAVENELEGKIFKGLAVLLNRERVVNHVQEGLSLEFKADYETFLSDLQKSFANDYAKRLVEFYDNEVARIVGNIKNPMIQADIRERCQKLLANNGAELIARVNRSLKNNHPELIMVRDGTVFIVGLLTTVFCEELGALAAQKIGDIVVSAKSTISSIFATEGAGAGTVEATATATAGAAGIGTQVASLVTAGVGSLMMGWAAFDAVYSVYKATDDLKEKFEDKAVAFFNQEAPDNMWDVLDESVTDGFEAAAQILQDILEETGKIKDDPDVQKYLKSLLQGRRDSVAEKFYQKLAAAALELGISLNDAQFLEDFAPAVLKTDLGQLPSLIKMIKDDRLRAKEWLAFAEPQEILDLYSKVQIHPGVWEKYPPTMQSLEGLRWIFTKVPDPAKALELDPADISWLISDFPGSSVPALFHSDKSADAIAEEIQRLHGIPVKAERRPWMNKFEFMFTQYRLYIFWGIGALAILIGAYLVLSILGKVKALFPSRKQSDKNKNTEQSDKKTEN